MIDLKKLSEPLTAEYLDFKLSQIVQSGKEGGIATVWASILCYIDARAVMKALDEAAGPMNWQVTYQRDTNGVLQASIGIWDEDKKQWVWKTSNGTASDFEAEKGEYSDAFKRAGFMWGIGRKLYDFPAIWMQLNEHDYYESSGKLKASSKLRPNEWRWTVSPDYKEVKAERKYGNSWKEIFNNTPYKKEK